MSVESLPPLVSDESTFEWSAFESDVALPCHERCISHWLVEMSGFHMLKKLFGGVIAFKPAFLNVSMLGCDKCC